MQGRGRLSYIDWVRGLAILVMIQAHSLDAWTRLSDRDTTAYGWSVIIGGLGAPMFLFLAGVSVALAAAARERKLGDAAAAAGSVRGRGWQIFGLAFLFRLQAYLLNPHAKPEALLKVDILNIMGPSIVAAAALWQVGRRFGPRLLLFAGVALAFTLLTPPIRSTHLIDWLPAPIEWYIRPEPGRSNFTLFPWAGFVFAGGVMGVLIARGWRDETRFQWALLAGSVLLAAGSCAGSYLPSIYANSSFWTTAPTYFLLRVGVVAALVPLTYFYERRPRPLARWVTWSPMAVFGRSSLFVYWVHTELAYGFLSTPLHKNLPFGPALAAFSALTLLMFGLTLLKNRLVETWRRSVTA